jgi:hypothetical protein
MSDNKVAPTPQTNAASDATLFHLSRVDNDTLMGLSELSLPQVEELKNEIATIFPAGNLPSLILSGLISADDRKITRKRADEDINTLFQGAKLLPRGLYSVLFAGPAVVLAAYQKILTLSGKSAEEAFPEGMWQFYLQFALREDTGRHTTETIGYHKDKPANAALIDDIASWVMASISTLFDADALMGTLWTEWTTLRLICNALVEAGIADEPPNAEVLRDWVMVRPYHTQGGQSYSERRRDAFEMFAQRYLEQLPTHLLQRLQQEMQTLAEQERDAFQSQMSLLAHLEPSRYRDERTNVRLWDAKVGVIWRGHTYLIDVVAKDDQGRPIAFTDTGESWPLRFDGAGNPLDPRNNPLVIQGGWLYRFNAQGYAEAAAYLLPTDPSVVKGYIQKIVQTPRPPAMSIVDRRLASAPRGEQSKLRSLLPKETQQAIWALANTPIIINWDQQEREQPLGLLRKAGQRGVGDHPLTIFRTQDSVVFDMSHIFFDNNWAMVMSEVITNQATAWAHYLVTAQPEAPRKPLEPLAFTASPQFEARSSELEQEYFPISAETDAETMPLDLSLVHQSRRWLRQRGVDLTVNDMLILARILHAALYKPGKQVAQQIAALPADLQKEVIESLEASRGINPAMLIPMDASFVNPKERIFPVTFRNPLGGLFEAFEASQDILKQYRVGKGDEEIWAKFNAQRKELLSYLKAFGDTLKAMKLIANRGETLNVASIKLLGNLPPQMQYFINQVPDRVGILSEIVKGEEVFSNVGRVAAESSLTRFASAKDDGRAKRLVWGILTDDKGMMHITLRDFRSHVVPLLKAKHEGLAQLLAKDYVDSYADALTRLAGQIAEISLADNARRKQ